MHIKLEHILLFAIAALMLYHFTKGCNCDGFSVGGISCNSNGEEWVPRCESGTSAPSALACNNQYTSNEPYDKHTGPYYKCSHNHLLWLCESDDTKCDISPEPAPVPAPVPAPEPAPAPEVYLQGKWVGKAPFCGAGRADCTALGKNWTEIESAADSSGLITKYNSIVQERRIFAIAYGKDPNKGLLSPIFTSSFGNKCEFGDKVYCELQSAK